MNSNVKRIESIRAKNDHNVVSPGVGRSRLIDSANTNRSFSKYRIPRELHVLHPEPQLKFSLFYTRYPYETASP